MPTGDPMNIPESAPTRLQRLAAWVLRRWLVLVPETTTDALGVYCRVHRLRRPITVREPVRRPSRSDPGCTCVVGDAVEYHGHHANCPAGAQ